MKIIYFTDHYLFPLKFKNWGDDFHSKKYLKEISNVKKMFKDKIDIHLGVEIDWLEDYKDWIRKQIKNKIYEYIIGSVHFMSHNKKYLPIDYSEKLWKKQVKKFGGVKNYVKEYYRQIRLMVKSKIFDCVGHFDKIKIYNKNSKLFSEKDNWYKDEILKTLDVIAKFKMCIEINTNGWDEKVGVQYPSTWILKEAKKRNISIAIGTDAHEKSEIIKNLDKAIKIAKSVGYKKIVRFENRKMIEVKI